MVKSFFPICDPDTSSSQEPEVDVTLTADHQNSGVTL